MKSTFVPLACVLLLSCGPRPPAEEPVQQEEPVVVPRASPEDEMEVTGLAGTLSQTEVNATMDSKGVMAFNLCFGFYLEDRDYLFGELKLKFEVLPSGKTSKVFLLHSTYGDYELEKCFVGKSKLIKFPKPHGGGTEVTYDFSTDTLPGVHEPSVGSSIKLKNALAPFKSEIKECLGGKNAGYTITFYLGGSMSEEVETESGKIVTRTLSRVLTLGGYGPGGERDGVECLYKASKSWKLAMDVDGIRKVTLEL